MPKTVKNDVTGKRFNSLVAVKFIPDDSSFSKFLFKCDCGNEKIIMTQSVIRGLTKSCGCFQRKMMKSRAVHGHNSIGNRSKTYNSWASMMDRCEWGGHKIMFSRYGEKGIRVCKEWHDFSKFLLDMGERPEGKSIDRIDNSKGYFKENCRWANRREQALNMKRTIFVIYENQKISCFELCNKLGISIGKFYSKKFRMKGDVIGTFKFYGFNVLLA